VNLVGDRYRAQTRAAFEIETLCKCHRLRLDERSGLRRTDLATLSIAGLWILTELAAAGDEFWGTWHERGPDFDQTLGGATRESGECSEWSREHERYGQEKDLGVEP